MTDQHKCRSCGDPATHRLFVPNGVSGELTKRIARILRAEVGDRVCMRCFCNALTMVQIENEGVTERIEVAL
jgi:hypothetical protein